MGSREFALWLTTQEILIKPQIWGTRCREPYHCGCGRDLGGQCVGRRGGGRWPKSPWLVLRPVLWLHITTLEVVKKFRCSSLTTLPSTPKTVLLNGSLIFGGALISLSLYCLKTLPVWACKLVRPLWKAGWSFLKKLKIELPYNPAIALLGIYPRDTGRLFWKGTCTPVFIAALSTVAKVWKELKCPSTDEWIKKMCYKYKMEYHSAIKNNEILPFATTWMELEGVMLREIRERQISCDFTHMRTLR